MNHHLRFPILRTSCIMFFKSRRERERERERWNQMRSVKNLKFEIWEYERRRLEDRKWCYLYCLIWSRELHELGLRFPVVWRVDRAILPKLCSCTRILFACVSMWILEHVTLFLFQPREFKLGRIVMGLKFVAQNFNIVEEGKKNSNLSQLK
jgi:hypothetical protein